MGEDWDPPLVKKIHPPVMSSLDKEVLSYGLVFMNGAGQAYTARTGQAYTARGRSNRLTGALISHAVLSCNEASMKPTLLGCSSIQENYLSRGGGGGGYLQCKCIVHLTNFTQAFNFSKPVLYIWFLIYIKQTKFTLNLFLSYVLWQQIQKAV